jgi:hypothetical protein
MEVTKMKSMVVKVQPWYWSDDDGCSDSGVSVWIDNILVSQYANDTAQLLRDVIIHLTGECPEIYGYSADDPICEDSAWEWRI